MATDTQKSYIQKIRELPANLTEVIKNLSEEQLTTVYIEREWTVAQNIHHIADANFNKYNLIRQILTEEEPELGGFKEEMFANFTDARHKSVDLSLGIIEGLHGRAVLLLESLSGSDWQKAGVSSYHGRLTVEAIVETFSTHGQRHIDQIKKTLEASKR